MTALCATRPAEWWDTGDDGNRLALAICGVCTNRPRCPQADPHPHGVIAAGVAYSDAGAPLPVCHCGYPQTTYRGGNLSCCRWCGLVWLPRLPRQLYWRARYRARKAAERAA